MQIDFRVGFSKHDVPPVKSVRFIRSMKMDKGGTKTVLSRLV